jgi:hypothetical protein
LAITLLGLAAYQLVTLAATLWGQGLVGSDVLQGYLPGAQRFLDTGSPFTADQLAGPWVLGYHSFIHPPAALPLFLAFLVLPLPLWWIIPIGVTTYAVSRLQPAPWAWPVMAACLVWPRSTGALLFGNSDIWAMAFVAAGAVWGWPIVALAVKPTFVPLALLAVRERRVWIAGTIAAPVMLPFAALWIDWLTVIRNGGLSWSYSLVNLPLIVMPAVAWGARPQGGGAARDRRADSAPPPASRPDTRQ